MNRTTLTVLACVALLACAETAAFVGFGRGERMFSVSEAERHEAAVAPAEAAALLEHGGPLTVIDVRTRREFDAGHVPGAVNIPMRDVAARANDLPEGMPVLVLSISGSRGRQAYKILKRLRPDLEIRYLSGKLRGEGLGDAVQRSPGSPK